ncbi:MAG: alginate export family protein [Bacteroidota bacterium]
MKRTCLLPVVLVLFVFTGVAQQEDTTLLSLPEFQFLRADENYLFLRDNQGLQGIWQKMKYLPIGDNSFVSIGGDIRSEFQVLNNEDWAESNDDAALFQRLMLHTDWRFGEHLRVFGQLKNGFTIGRNGPKFPLDDDDLDVHQLFIGLELGNSTFEIGRREIRYGARRLISVREGTNIRQSFDGARWIWKGQQHQFDALIYAYNPQRTGVFDNAINTDQLLWGGYWVWNVPKAQDLNFDVYYLGVRNDASSFEEGNDQETRHSFGLRHWGSQGRWRYNNEAIFQAGSYGNGNIRAWTISTDTYFRFPGKSSPTLGLKAEVISGDDDPLDGDLQTFNPLYPRGGYFGLLALIGPANIFDLHPSFSLSFGESLQLSLDWDFFWRHRLNDGIYFPSGRLNVSGQGAVERFIGHQPGVQLSYVINPYFEIETSYFLFIAGDFIDEVADGQNFSQLGLSISIKY